MSSEEVKSDDAHPAITQKTDIDSTSGDKAFCCKFCNASFSIRWELRKHHMLQHGTVKAASADRMTCDKCSRTFALKRELSQHMRSHGKDRFLECGQCYRKFTTRQYLLHHVVVHTGVRPFKCGICGFAFTQLANLRTHTRKKHPLVNVVSGQCPYCEEVCLSIGHIHEHIREFHPEVLTQTLAEMEEFPRCKTTRRHRVLTAAYKRKIELRCRGRCLPPCDFRIKDPWSPRIRYDMPKTLVRGYDWDEASANDEYHCQQCIHRSAWRYEDMLHKVWHEFKNTSRVVCCECNMKFASTVNLKPHLLTHTKENYLVCLHCWRLFSSHAILETHLTWDHLRKNDSCHLLSCTVKVADMFK